MDRAEILRSLTALGADLQEHGLTADLYIVGGAAIALAYDDRRATRDIDALFVPKAEVYAAAGRVRDQLDLPEGWLNDAVKGFLLGPDPFTTEVIDLPGVRCEVASPEMVLVLKCLAHRTGEDDDDVRLLRVSRGSWWMPAAIQASIRQGGGGADTGVVSATTTTPPVGVWAPWAPPKTYGTPLCPGGGSRRPGGRSRSRGANGRRSQPADTGGRVLRPRGAGGVGAPSGRAGAR